MRIWYFSNKITVLLIVKNMKSMKKYVFKLATKEEADAWVKYVKERIAAFDKRRNSLVPTEVASDTSEEGGVVLLVGNDLYSNIVEQIYPVSVSPLETQDVNRLFLSIDELDVPDRSGRVKTVLKSLGCKNLGDVLFITEKQFKSHKLAGKKTWFWCCDTIEQYGFKPEKPLKGWSFGNVEYNNRLFRYE